MSAPPPVLPPPPKGKAHLHPNRAPLQKDIAPPDPFASGIVNEYYIICYIIFYTEPISVNKMNKPENVIKQLNIRFKSISKSETITDLTKIIRNKDNWDNFLKQYNRIYRVNRIDINNDIYSYNKIFKDERINNIKININEYLNINEDDNIFRIIENLLRYRNMRDSIQIDNIIHNLLSIIKNKKYKCDKTIITDAVNNDFHYGTSTIGYIYNCVKNDDDKGIRNSVCTQLIPNMVLNFNKDFETSKDKILYNGINILANNDESKKYLNNVVKICRLFNNLIGNNKCKLTDIKDRTLKKHDRLRKLLETVQVKLNKNDKYFSHEITDELFNYVIENITANIDKIKIPPPGEKIPPGEMDKINKIFIENIKNARAKFNNDKKNKNKTFYLKDICYELYKYINSDDNPYNGINSLLFSCFGHAIGLKYPDLFANIQNQLIDDDEWETDDEWDDEQ